MESWTEHGNLRSHFCLKVAWGHTYTEQPPGGTQTQTHRLHAHPSTGNSGGLWGELGYGFFLSRWNPGLTHLKQVLCWWTIWPTHFYFCILTFCMGMFQLGLIKGSTVIKCWVHMTELSGINLYYLYYVRYSKRQYLSNWSYALRKDCRTLVSFCLLMVICPLMLIHGTLSQWATILNSY